MGLSDCRGHLRMGLAGWPKARPRRDRAALELNRVCRRVLGIERCPASLGPENNSDGHGLCSMDRHRSRRDVRAGPDAVQRGGDAGAVLLRRADRHRYRRIEVLERLTPVAMRGKVRKKSRKREEKGTGKGDALISRNKRKRGRTYFSATRCENERGSCSPRNKCVPFSFQMCLTRLSSIHVGILWTLVLHCRASSCKPSQWVPA